MQAEPEATKVELAGSATFLQLPKLSEVLDSLPEHGRLKVSLRQLAHVDHTCAELFKDWLTRRRARGSEVDLEVEPGADRLTA